MDSVLVIIRLTGLLLFSQPTNGPMHVLMPFELGGMSPHVAQIGYYTHTDTGCVKWVPDGPAATRGVCFIRLDSSTIEIGTPGNSRSIPLPVGNVSHAINRDVEQEFLRPVLRNVSAIRRLKGRITLNQGGITHECRLGRFEFRNRSGRDSVDLVNVVTWTYKLPPNARLDLQRRRFRAAGPRDTAWTVSPNRDTIELFIRHVPDPDPPRPMRRGEEVRHYRAYYSLLRPNSSSGPVPRFGRLHVGNVCSWPVSRTEKLLPTNAGTMSCMIAAGDPP